MAARSRPPWLWRKEGNEVWRFLSEKEPDRWAVGNDHITDSPFPPGRAFSSCVGSASPGLGPWPCLAVVSVLGSPLRRAAECLFSRCS